MARRSDVPSIGLVDTNFFVSCLIPTDRSPYSFAAVLPEDMSAAVHLAAENAAPLTDACLAAVALRLCEGNVITNDRHMGRLPGIKRFSYVPPRPDLV